MKLKSGISQKKDVIYLVIAAILTLLLAVYLFWLVKGLTEKANSAFSNEPDDKKIRTFDFNRYDAVMDKVFPPTSTLPVASSTKL